MKRFLICLALMTGTAHAAEAYRPGTVQAVPYDAVSVRTTNALGAYTNVVRVVCSTSCYIALGASPSIIASAATGTLLPALIPEYFTVAPGEHFAVIKLTTTGTLTVTEMTK
jgi:hypothetical protein